METAKYQGNIRKAILGMKKCPQHAVKKHIIIRTKKLPFHKEMEE